MKLCDLCPANNMQTYRDIFQIHMHLPIQENDNWTKIAESLSKIKFTIKKKLNLQATPFRNYIA